MKTKTLAQLRCDTVMDEIRTLVDDTSVPASELLAALENVSDFIEDWMYALRYAVKKEEGGHV